MKKNTPSITVAIKMLSRLMLLALGLVLFTFSAALPVSRPRPTIVAVLSSGAMPYAQSLQGFKDNISKSGIDHELTVFDLSKTGREEVLGKIRALNPAIVHTIGTEATKSLKDSFPDTPVIFSMVLNPVDSGLVKSMRSPGANISGASLDIPLEVQFSHIRKLFPRAKKIGVIYSENETGTLVAHAERAARDAGFQLVKKRVESGKDVPGALGRLLGEIDLLWSVADQNVFTKETAREILLASIKEKVPFIGLSASFVKAGALAALEVDPYEIGAQAAEAARASLNGRTASGIPVSAPHKVKILLNTNTMKLMDISIPQEVYTHAEKVQP